MNRSTQANAASSVATFVGLSTVVASLAGSVLIPTGIPFAIVGIALSAFALCLAIGGVIWTVAAIVRRQGSLIPCIANAAIFACGATLTIVGIVEIALRVWSIQIPSSL